MSTGTDWVDRVLAWSELTRRNLPWRRTRDPWAVLVAETMLQQTSVARVEPRWHAFLEVWPDPPACAAAAPGAVVAAWVGLGYNRRAVALHRTAVAVTADHGGRVPDDLGTLLTLPGVGPYTARAVLVFAYEQPVAVVDTNVGRVLARAVAGRRLGRAEAQALADAAVPSDAPWAWNQALLDLGATVCTGRRPRCPACPLVATCAWRSAGPETVDPALGSAGVTVAQSRFAGSDRQGRGRLVAALTGGPVGPDDVPAAAGWPEDPARSARIAAALVTDGIAVRTTGGGLRLP